MTMPNVTVIPPRKFRVTTTTEEKPKIRVAAYCRVSTDSEEQASSYEVQVEHYTEHIKKNENWTLVDIYADDGISGTNTKKRDEFNRLIRDCKDGKVDLIITKSISRFARNTLDCLKYIRELKEKGVAVFFEKENINTLEAKGEILITIMASLAQQESQSLSQNVKLGLQFRYQQGIVQVNHNRFLGYTKNEEKKLVIDKAEAEIVKRIFREYIEGASLLQIGRGLEQDGIKTAAGKSRWRPETIKNILRNEKYMGDALLQKTYTVDFLLKKRVKNNGIIPQYYVEGSHEAIIPKDIFMRVQEEIIRRANIAGDGHKKRIYSGKYALSGIVYCGCCGDVYRRVHWNNRGCKSVVWRCVERLEDGTRNCFAPTIKEDILQKAVVDAINSTLGDNGNFLKVLKNNIATVVSQSENAEITVIDNQLKELQKQLISIAGTTDGYDEIASEILRLKEEKDNMLISQAEKEGFKKRMEDMTAFLETCTEELTEYDEQLTRQLIERITIFDDKFVVEFKSGIEVEIKNM